MAQSYTHSVRIEPEFAARFKQFVASRGLKLGWATEEAMRQWMERIEGASPAPLSGAAAAAGGSERAAGSGAQVRADMRRGAENVAVRTIRPTAHADGEPESGEWAET